MYADDLPTYHLANINVVDDHETGITHVLRVEARQTRKLKGLRVQNITVA